MKYYFVLDRHVNILFSCCMSILTYYFDIMSISKHLICDILGEGEITFMCAYDFNLCKETVPTGMAENYLGYILGAAKYCLDRSGHSSGVVSDVKGCFSGEIHFFWESISQKERNTYRDPGKATEKGAEGVAFVVIDKFTEYKISAQSYVRTGFDFYLVPKSCNDDLDELSGEYLKLEVSGIDKKSASNKIETRVRDKNKQAATIKDGKEYYVVVA